jgi:hypothetical protein
VWAEIHRLGGVFKLQLVARFENICSSYNFLDFLKWFNNIQVFKERINKIFSKEHSF